MFKYEVLVLGELQTNCYLLWDEESKEAVVIDAADDGVAISEEIERLQLKLKYILATHGHFDHNLGVLDLKLIYNIPYAASQKDLFLLKRQQETAKHFLKMEIKVPNLKKIDVDLDQRDEIEVGGKKIKIIKTPGHTPGGLAFLADNLLFSGDIIFAEGMRGQTSYGYSSSKEIYESIDKVLCLPEYTEILPGHGEETTVGEAREFVKKT
ncbi:MAG: Metallo-beta-lactamase family protein [Candidatus Shapirobacteria bacterium GW2011_GWE1_38_10]|uniref:Metallo-beta-lactamase family protein n=1 Tax=Candidatus Shapirobacteria bacterium GW2011_GWE1_38_10 TaxID=1618488 RepID=A0A0G0LAP1_9BACT|nr:MAG: Metallo-beta-lactamase family protein [Candidatus Shapirobacteria bacterium GW2011_GWF2_37_20]KKQ49711.1 MAG: Metallo-beta-lactamase family protein [Candidatus Shapirobacteria bacterium GW2011_GWE1_38_10]KKQ64420.1 MAG: Metallo-beta-lactamase family protein [Candidatus Shapirobacteria bacterium GW2011_GWF1_38_23]